MPFTTLLALFDLLIVVVVFAAAYKIKGRKTAFITAAITFFVLAVLSVGAVALIVSAMTG